MSEQDRPEYQRVCIFCIQRFWSKNAGAEICPTCQVEQSKAAADLKDDDLL